MPVNELTRKIAGLEARLNKKPKVKGARVMADIDTAPNTYFLRRPSGIIGLDIDTGGGLPAGGLTYLSGPDGTGKTFLLYKYLAMNQRLYGKQSAQVLAVSEAAPDHFWMRRCGVQLAIPEEMIAERVDELKRRGLPSFTKEDLKSLRTDTVGELKILRGATGEELLESMLKCFEAKCFDLICLDSVSACLPEADAMKDLDEPAKRAAAAGMLTRFFQHYLNGTTGYYGPNPTTVIFTAQVRANNKKAEAMAHIQKFLPDYAAMGAWAAKHGKLIDILVKPGSKEREVVKGVGPAAEAEEKEKQKQKKVAVSKTVNYEIMKGKAGVHDGVTGEFDFHFEKLTEDQKMIVEALVQQGIAAADDGYITVYNPTTMEPLEGLKKLAGVDRLVDMMKADFELELLLRRMLLTAAGVQCAYR
jgi:RecA/RadA recombinase